LLIKTHLFGMKPFFTMSPRAIRRFP